MITVSTLVGTSASSLEPVFINSVVSHGFNSEQLNYKDISIQGENDNPFVSPIINAPKNILSIAVTSDGSIWIGSDNGLYRSTDSNTFNKVMDEFNVNSILITSDKIIWVGTGNGLYKSTDNGTTFNKIMNNDNTITVVKSSNNGTIYVGKYQGLYKIDLLNNVFDSFSSKNKPDYFGNKYNGFVYKNEQIIELKPDYLKNATLDGVTIDVSSKQKITIGIKHNLVLTLNNKDNCNQYLDLFGGDPTNGQIIYNFWIKNEIGKDEFNYSTITHDTDLLTGLVANISTANTYNSPIIQTRQKSGSGVITLNAQVTSEMINLETSYYEQGTINVTTNDFTATGSKQKVNKNLIISNEGIYHLHLVDVVGNTYDSYLELGEKNWKLKGTFDDKTFNDLARTLNVTVNIISTDDKKVANGWLDNYKNLTDSTFNNTVLIKGKGFNISIESDLKGNYKSFLDPVTYVDSKTQYAINQGKLTDEIIKIAEQKLRDVLFRLPQGLNVDTSNVVNKLTLDNYSNWIKNYKEFIDF